jgi:hypothetical protein
MWLSTEAQPHHLAPRYLIPRLLVTTPIAPINQKKNRPLRWLCSKNRARPPEETATTEKSGQGTQACGGVAEIQRGQKEMSIGSSSGDKGQSVTGGISI